MQVVYMENPNGYINPTAPFRAQMSSLPPKCPSRAVLCGPIQAVPQVDMPRSCSTNVLIEEQPSWLDDLLNEPETPVNKGHRRSSSDPFVFTKPNKSLDEHCLRSSVEGSTWGFQMPHSFKGQDPLNTKPSSSHEQQDELWKPSSTCPPLLKGVTSSKEDDDLKALGLSCSPTETDRTKSVGSETQNLADGISHTLENSCIGTDSSQMKLSIPPSASRTDSKRKQHNARRSRVRKLQYIAELEMNVRALQVQGAEVSAQLEFLDQQNLILGLENRALKQRLESLSQEHLIKSMEQEILDRELGRLQYLYHVQNLNHHQQRQRQNHNPAVHRRGQSCDLDSQFAKLNLNLPEPIATSNGFRDFPHRN